MDIPPPSPTVAHSPPPPLTDGTGLSSNHPEWYQNLLKCIDTLSLNWRALSKEEDGHFGAIESQQAEILQILRSQLPRPPPPQ